MRKLVPALLMLMILAGQAYAQTDKVEILQDENGYRIMVNDEPYEVKGVVWSFTPIGENYNYDLWSQPEEFIQELIDKDAALMKAIGVNTIRVFDDVPPKWIEYIYMQHGIRSIINPLFGRYGMTVRGMWHAATDYSDWYTRLAIQEESLDVVETYKDVPGVLMFLFGNENNYGLEWDAGGAIEDLPVGQQMEMRAGYLYSLVEETISVAKTIDPDHPMGFVNGDLQYFNVIKELVPSLDILGINTYRGSKSYDLFFQSISELGVPFVYTELGADAWNAAQNMEDQYNQAVYIRSQWEEIYQNAWGKAGRQNCLGGFVFEWMDEWWKHGMEQGLLVHDTEGTWTNGGYRFDAVPGVNNMNEEWFGIIAQSELKDNGVNRRIPRAAYYMLGDIWQLSLYDSTDAQVENYFSGIDPAKYMGLAEGRSLRNYVNEQPVTVENLSLETVMSGSFTDADIYYDGGLHKEGVNWQTSEVLDTTFGLNLRDRAKGFARLKVHGNSFDPIFTTAPPQAPVVDLYQAQLTYSDPLFDLTGYYHSGHPDWAAQGDWFFLMPESFDFFNMDVDGSKAPYGVEFQGKDVLEGLTVYAGPEIYWGARPQIMAKYMTDIQEESWNAGGSLIYYEELGLGDSEITPETTRGGSVYGYFNLWPYIRVDAGGLFSGMDKVGDSYLYARPAAEGAGGITYPADPAGTELANGSDWDIHQDGVIDYFDTLAGKVELSTDLLRYTHLYARYIYAGLVAESKAQIVRGGFFKGDEGLGNRQEVNLGSRVIIGDFTLWPEFRWRAPLEGPMPAGLGFNRQPVTDPFTVFHNREVMEGEMVVTYDPTGATWFHEWNWEDLENADFAASGSVIYTLVAGATDPTYYIDENSVAIYNPFGSGLPEQRGLWAAKAKVYLQPAPSARIAAEARIGHEGSFGESARIVNYLGGSLKAQYGRFVLDGYLDWDSWGPENWYRTFNFTFPYQWKADLSYHFDKPSFLEPQGRVGLFCQGRSYDQFSADIHEGLLMEIGMHLNFSY